MSEAESLHLYSRSEISDAAAQSADFLSEYSEEKILRIAHQDSLGAKTEVEASAIISEQLFAVLQKKTKTIRSPLSPVGRGSNVAIEYLIKGAFIGAHAAFDLMNEKEFVNEPTDSEDKAKFIEQPPTPRNYRVLAGGLALLGAGFLLGRGRKHR